MNRKNIFVYISIFFCFTSFVKHPHHVGVVEITYNVSNNELQIAGKWFVDDIEEVLQKKYNYKKDLIRNASELASDSVAVTYFKKNLILKQNNLIMSLDCIGAEHEKGALWVYFVVKNFKTNVELICIPQVLCDHLKDQSHIIHFIKGDKRESFTSNCSKSIIKYKW